MYCSKRKVALTKNQNQKYIKLSENRKKHMEWLEVF